MNRPADIPNSATAKCRAFCIKATLARCARMTADHNFSPHDLQHCPMPLTLSMAEVKFLSNSHKLQSGSESRLINQGASEREERILPSRSHSHSNGPPGLRSDQCCAVPSGICTCASEATFRSRSVSCSSRLRMNSRPSP